jgi:hypothetical protein
MIDINIGAWCLADRHFGFFLCALKEGKRRKKKEVKDIRDFFFLSTFQ